MVGLSRSNQMTARDAVSLAEMMVKRAAGLHHNFGDGSAASAASASETDFPALQCDKPAEVLDMLFKLTEYNYPDSIALPKDYVPPSMAIATPYWTVSCSVKCGFLEQSGSGFPQLRIVYIF